MGDADLPWAAATDVPRTRPGGGRGVWEHGEAGKWIAFPEDSSHATGTAVDIGRTDAAYWFSWRSPEFGLRQTYADEIWHHGLAVEPGGTCLGPLADAPTD
ncbi:hypothetical protein [Nocardiopsis ansamitocini]|uniref:Uncharacterized protein n=1 Tax=Nocardiopsis ansamitocini TaxID=1670832 RepID=A0A9W6P7I3_9ACTN|nr:hypothetical protein [Nocardiopsis ansamitocini]GLU48428.1 hypothetical protein Nans01_27790 [Nocardiopsis ansamitocini]